MSSQSYVSPLMSRIRDAEVLSLQTLARYVPIAQRGFAAAAKLSGDTEALSLDEVRQLTQDLIEGEDAKERLTLISMPLIKSIARREFSRRQSWSSRATIEDIISEGLAGLMRGIKAYNPEGNHSSPTNYLGQWITTEMRRNAELLDHDFSIPYEAMDRHRKIRAIRSRLTAELGREPTDEEIVEASSDSSYARDRMIGKSAANKAKDADKPKPRRRIMTVKHIQEERDMFTRTGAVRTIHGVTEEQEQGLADHAILSKVGSEIGDNDCLGNQLAVDDRESHFALSQLLEDTFVLMRVGSTQQEVIRRRFGLNPYGQEQTIKDIVLHTGVPKHRVTRIITAFSAEMSRPRSPFHQVMSRLGADEAESMGMSWVYAALGKFVPPAVPSESKDLLGPLSPTVPDEAPRPGLTNSPAYATGVQALFNCKYENFYYRAAYRDERSVPLIRTCPRCRKTSTRVKDE